MMSEPTHIISMTEAAFWTARETAADERQAQIVAMIKRNFDAPHVADIADRIAQAIMRGDHLKHAPE